MINKQWLHPHDTTLSNVPAYKRRPIKIKKRTYKRPVMADAGGASDFYMKQREIESESDKANREENLPACQANNCGDSAEFEGEDGRHYCGLHTKEYSSHD